mmetsp:Transcript_8009/g.15775  ORF Transcript_8009/g.15775 Transcript_8009/m.15775 type:complete len:397 (-) Transcript_8009:486-1676(-)|eukprot:CAMPEP_0204916562 /NCGR_PEP_ID=MMETSP1397-20131031/14333_1 /ASSEMBLY_ACC=CAM_ASM_000891 /TAXON_ID=49980 /ORGANISM="Climacostomum Climacostomum virens, Strain Stock W-24" /LENGTH=396 /DNA_ID=CAMNT_0052089089 /DNA_START=324 /DNA_END=1514 /DNA_ORIENTATION=-
MQRKNTYMRTPTSIMDDKIHIALNDEDESESTEDSQSRVFHINLRTFEASELGVTDVRRFTNVRESVETPFMLVFRDITLDNLRQVRAAFELHPVIELECKTSLYNVKDSLLAFEGCFLINFAELTHEEGLEKTSALKLIVFSEAVLCLSSQSSYTFNTIGKQLNVPQLCTKEVSINSAPVRKMSLPTNSPDLGLYYGLSPVEALLFRIFNVNVNRLENYVLKLLSEAMFTSVYASEISYHERVDFIWRLSITSKSLIHLSDLIKPKTTLFIKLRRQGVLSNEFNPYLDSLVSRCQSLEQRINTTKELLTTSEQIYSASADDYLSTLSNRMNEIMQVFSAIATIFLPLNLIGGLWGMNVVVPGQDEESLWPFAVITGSCIVLAVVVLLVFFRKKII